MPSTENIRLVGGSRTSEHFSGRVEVRPTNGRWGTIIDERFGHREATVICRMFGYQRGIERNRAYFGKGKGHVFNGLLECNGTEESLFGCSCYQRCWESDAYWHSRDAGVECFRDKGSVWL